MSKEQFPDQNRPDRALIVIRGETALSFLHNILTCTTLDLAEGSATYGALLSPQGKILHDLFVINQRQSVAIDCAADQAGALIQKLVLYRLRAKLMFEVDNTREVGVHMIRPESVFSYVDPRNPSMGWRSISDAGSFINAVGITRYDKHRINLGLADSVQDISSDRLFPHEANFDQFEAVDFKKGCYIGQEVVSRMQHRGTARNRMLPIQCDKHVAPGTFIEADGVRIGHVSSASGQSALALLRIDRLAESKAPLYAEGTRVHVRKPAWIKFALDLPEASQ
jgi:tRNA-modifying protein YgfZ